MVARIQATCQCNLSEVATTEIAGFLNAPITEQEFTDGLDHIQKNRAPGLSIVTTNMIRVWSPVTLPTSSLVFLKSQHSTQMVG
jgi:hypothetical protein